MLKEERQRRILNELKRRGKILTPDLSRTLNVSEDTIRRDLKELSDQGRAKKVHGGAILVSANPFDFREREVYALQAKKQLAAAMLPILKKDWVAFMDGGTTNMEVARLIPADLSLTVFTNSLPIANILAEKEAVRAVVLGGNLLRSARVTVGPEVIRQIQGVRADLCILGTRSLHQETGISEIDWDETQVKRAMVDASDSLYSLVIEDKLGTTQPYMICSPGKITGIITNASVTNSSLDLFHRLGTEIITV